MSLGGLIMLSQKHSSATKVNYRSGFFITTNVLPDFGQRRDQDAINRRLSVFTTKTLPKKNTSVTGNKNNYIYTTRCKPLIFQRKNINMNFII